MKRPSFQFYTGDWMKDPNLSMCSPATRGIWVDLLCAMHENESLGFITATVVGFSRICRCSPDEILNAFEELKTTATADFSPEIVQILSKKCRENVEGFPACNEKVTVICRRMYKDAKTRERGRNRVQRFRKNTPKDVGNENVTFPSSSSTSVFKEEEPKDRGYFSERVHAHDAGQNGDVTLKKPTRIANDFALNSEMRNWATEMQIPPEIDLKNETELFKNKYLSQSGDAALSLDWFASWKNWILRGKGFLERDKKNGQNQSPRNIRPNKTDVVADYDYTVFDRIEFKN